MRILIMGLPGSGKTHLALRLHVHLNCAWYNADSIRKMANDWDFSNAGRRRQAERMNTVANFEGNHGRTVICDFVCPTPETRNMFDADLTIWMDTIESGRYDNTNKIFVDPDVVDYHVKGFMSDEEIINFAEDLKAEYNV